MSITGAPVLKASYHRSVTGYIHMLLVTLWAVFACTTYCACVCVCVCVCVHYVYGIDDVRCLGE